MKKIGFGGGCHWCTEAVFQSLNGVEFVEQGWISSLPPDDAFSEAVVVHYDENISLEILIAVHLLTHSSASKHSMRHKYRSAVYYFDRDDQTTIETIISRLAKEDNIRYITQTLPFNDFKSNAERYLDYYKRGKEKPFCQTNISPKLRAIREKFGQQVRSDF